MRDFVLGCWVCLWHPGLFIKTMRMIGAVYEAGYQEGRRGDAQAMGETADKLRESVE